MSSVWSRVADKEAGAARVVQAWEGQDSRGGGVGEPTAPQDAVLMERRGSGLYGVGGRGGGCRAKLSLGPRKSNTRACHPGAEFQVRSQRGAVLAPRPTCPALRSFPLPSSVPGLQEASCLAAAWESAALAAVGLWVKLPRPAPGAPSLFFPASCCPTAEAVLTKPPGPQPPRFSEVEGGLLP